MADPLFTIGTDPEFPLWGITADRWISAIPLIAGNKKNPEILSNGAFLQHDNVALEFATTPAKTLDEFIFKIQETFDLAIKKLPEDVLIKVIPSAEFLPLELNTPEAMEAGCDPDFDAWQNGKINKISVGISETPLRSFGGHVHIGYTNETKWLCTHKNQVLFVQFLDILLGFTSVILDNNDASIKRKKLYGKAGAYRNPSHGVEYRTLSNFWLKNQNTVSLIYNLVNDSVNYYNQYDTAPIIYQIGPYSIRKIINSGKSDLAEGWLNSFQQVGIISDKSWELFNLCKDNAEQETTIIEDWNLRKAA